MVSTRGALPSRIFCCADVFTVLVAPRRETGPTGTAYKSRPGPTQRTLTRRLTRRWVKNCAIYQNNNSQLFCGVFDHTLNKRNGALGAGRTLHIPMPQPVDALGPVTSVPTKKLRTGPRWQRLKGTTPHISSLRFMIFMNLRLTLQVDNSSTRISNYYSCTTWTRSFSGDAEVKEGLLSTGSAEAERRAELPAMLNRPVCCFPAHSDETQWHSRDSKHTASGSVSLGGSWPRPRIITSISTCDNTCDSAQQSRFFDVYATKQQAKGLGL